MTRTSSSSTSACIVCLDSHQLTIVHGPKRVATSRETARKKLGKWASRRLQTHPCQELKTLVDCDGFADDMQLCRSCNALVTKIDRLEVELERNWTKLWSRFGNSRTKKKEQNLEIDSAESTFPSNSGTSTDLTWNLSSETNSASELLKIAVKEIFDGGSDELFYDPGHDVGEDKKLLNVSSEADLPSSNGATGAARRSVRLNSPRMKRRRIGQFERDGPHAAELNGSDEDLARVEHEEDKVCPERVSLEPSAIMESFEHTCPICQEFFPDGTSLGVHMASWHEPCQPFRCEVCALEFKTAKLLGKHRRKEHDGMEPSFACKFCGQVFESRKRLQVHKRKHEGVICPICGKFFLQDRANANAVRDHIAAIHKGEKNYRCEVCGDTFGYQRNLAKHRRQSHGINKEKAPAHDCEVCGKVLWERGALIQHVFYVHGKVIDESRMVKCEYCSKDFVRGWRFNRHVAAHRQEKPHACPDCNYRTPDFTKLRLHLRDVHKRNVKRVFPEGFEKLATNYTLVDVDETGEIISPAN